MKFTHMKKRLFLLPFRWLTTGLRHWPLLSALLLTAAVGYLYYRFRQGGEITLSVQTENPIQITPQQIRSIEDIGEWEFLAVSTEEMVDTVRKRFLSADRLTRIYTGTMRLGLNMKEVRPGWLTTQGDTVNVQLPAIRLLDKNFIDEARTRSFYEKGYWNGKAKEQMYHKARQAMLRRGLTRNNLQQAEQNARAQIENLFRSLGFHTVNITFIP